MLFYFDIVYGLKVAEQTFLLRISSTEQHIPLIDIGLARKDNFSHVTDIMFARKDKGLVNRLTLLAKHYCFHLESGATFLSIANDLEADNSVNHV